MYKVAKNGDEYHETSTGIKISKKAHIYRAQSVSLCGRDIFCRQSLIRGDLGTIRIGRYCIFDEHTVLQPSFAKKQSSIEHHCLFIGDYVLIHKNTIVNAKKIGSFIYIGENVVIGRNSVINDCCIISDNTVIAPNTIIPSFSLVTGNPYEIHPNKMASFQFFITNLIECFYNDYQ